MYDLVAKRNCAARVLKEAAEMLESQIHDSDNSMIDCKLDTDITLHEYNKKICTKRIILDIRYEEDLK